MTRVTSPRAAVTRGARHSLDQVMAADFMTGPGR